VRLAERRRLEAREHVVVVEGVDGALRGESPEARRLVDELLGSPADSIARR
jgi:hypothetical protein